MLDIVKRVPCDQHMQVLMVILLEDIICVSLAVRSFASNCNFAPCLGFKHLLGFATRPNQKAYIVGTIVWKPDFLVFFGGYPVLGGLEGRVLFNENCDYCFFLFLIFFFLT